ncbi:MAG: hypothetical protein NT003_01290, partial [Candidatus Magasanikbacteria bacterium]|nr:hypothetical protein [Candidatus Magasanikbacteria bacterium]
DHCDLDHVVISPADAEAHAQGDVQEFVAHPYSKPDVCYPSGQELKLPDIWNWWAEDTDVADFVTATTTDKQTFAMIGNGVVDPGTSAQTTRIRAIPVGMSFGTLTSANWSLTCVSPPVACPSNTYPGSDKCCHLSPHVTATFPDNVSTNVCRNALITIDVNDYLNGETVNTSTIQLGVTTSTAACGHALDSFGQCLGLIPYSLTLINSTDADLHTRNGRIIVNLDAPLPANSTVSVYVGPVITGLLNAAENQLLKSGLNVPVTPYEFVFATSNKFCQLDKVSVYPHNTYFTKLSQSQKMFAEGMSNQGGLFVPISQITNAYTWDWNWNTNKKVIADFSITAASIDGNAATTTIPGGVNGATTVSAIAKITTDIVMASSTVGTSIADSANVQALLCEIPWIPAQNANDGVKSILDRQNFNFWYCRTSGKNILNTLSTVSFTAAQFSDLGQSGAQTYVNGQLVDKPSFSFTTLDAFQLIDTPEFGSATSSGGSIGFRVEKNLKQYSAYEWYYQKQFNAKVQPIAIDGFDGVRVGNTAYIGFVNQKNGVQYSNMLVVSLSEPASDEMKGIFDQIINNLRFAINVSDIGLCYTGTNALNKQCNVNGQCAGLAVTNDCHADHSKLVRDFKRVIDSSTMVRALDKANAFAGKYPIIAADSFISGLTSSKWPSWAAFMSQLGIDPVADPLNVYDTCGPDSDSATCWSIKNKVYQCSTDSHVYHYNTVSSGANYKLGIPLEQGSGNQSSWAGEWTGTVRPHISNGEFCNNASFGASSVCGDGIVGAGEQCDPPGKTITGIDTNICTAYGAYSTQCSSSCQIVVAAASCVNLCGDGIINGNEVCDDGSKYNGKYNYCNLQCSGPSTLGSCGDGIKQSNEFCDVAKPNESIFITTVGDPIFPTYSGIRCHQVNGVQGFYSGFIDVTSPTVKNDLLTSASFQTVQSATLNLCKGAVTTPYGHCSLHSDISCNIGAYFPCPQSETCISASAGSTYAPVAADSCNWDCKGVGSYCGDLKVDTLNGEECDGNTHAVDNAGDACTVYCTSECKFVTPPVSGVPVCAKDAVTVAQSIAIGCGNGIVDPADGEECDTGSLVGVACVPQYGAKNSCQYCDNHCKRAYVTGGYCGDNAINGPEACDGGKVFGGPVCPIADYDYTTFTCTPSCVVTKNGSCQNCAVNTKTFTDQQTINATLVSMSPAVLMDPTLGWLPALIDVSATFAYTDPSLAPRAINFATPVLLNPVVDVTKQTITTALDKVRFDGSNSCFTAAGGASYYVTFAAQQIVGEVFVDYQDLSLLPYVGYKTLSLGAQVLGGGISDFSGSTVFNSKQDLGAAKTIQVDTDNTAQAGDYRIVYRGSSKDELKVVWIDDQAVTGSLTKGLTGSCVPVGRTANESPQTWSANNLFSRLRQYGCLGDSGMEQDQVVAFTSAASSAIFEPASRQVVTLRGLKNGWHYYVYVHENHLPTPGGQQGTFSLAKDSFGNVSLPDPAIVPFDADKSDVSVWRFDGAHWNLVQKFVPTYKQVDVDYQWHVLKFDGKTSPLAPSDVMLATDLNTDKDMGSANDSIAYLYAILMDVKMSSTNPY